ncbi:MAG TPA: energy transducer TonB [Terriglobales bacterium]|nr:energy transducer TonB [Terriglobales bacterium]
MIRRVKSLIAVVLTAVALAGTAALPTSAQEEGRKVKTRVNPTYPDLAKRMKVSGTVKVMVTIEPNGTVKTAKPVGGHPLLVEPAVEAAKKWKYEPASAESTEVVEFHFDGE